MRKNKLPKGVRALGFTSNETGFTIWLWRWTWTTEAP